jgi:uncharacterized protein (UPF0335 family)
MAKKAAPVKDEAVPAAPVKDEPKQAPKGRPDEPFITLGNQVFKTREDLEKVWPSMLPKSEYTKKTQALSQQWQALERREQELKDLQRKQDEQIAEWKLYKDTFNSRPDLQEKWKQDINQIPSPDVAVERAQGYTDEQLKAYEDRIAKLESDAQEREYQAQLDGIFNDLSGDFPNLDRDAVTKRLYEIGQEDNTLPTLVRLAAQAHAAESAPQAVEAAKAKLESRDEANLVPPSGHEPVETPAEPVSIEEAGEAARQKIYESGG